MSVGTPVVITHPCSLFRDGLRQTLTRSRFRPVRQLSIVNADVEEYLHSADDCVWLLGVDQFEATNEQLVRQITTSNHLVRAVILAASQVAIDIVRALNAGACGFLRQDITGDQLLKSLELIVTGQTVIYPQFWITASQAKARDDAVTDGAKRTPYLLESFAAATCECVAEEDSSCQNLPGAGVARGLSNRELAILRTLMEGASNKVIARRLVITEATVKVHMKAILRKLRLQNRTQAAIWARSYLGETVATGAQ
jgi:two-component system, NarL family, nitrate/nitrite response regulator NarL